MNLLNVANRRYLTCWLLTYASLPLTVSRAELIFEASWAKPTYAQVRQEVLSWLEGEDLADEIAFQARSMWPERNLRSDAGTAMLERVAETVALVEPRAKALLSACNAPYTGPVPPAASWLEDAALPAVIRSNLRLYYARWLAQHTLYDEVVSTLSDVETDDVVDPASLLFYRMIAYHQLVEPDMSQLHLIRLMEQPDQLPARYLRVARLMQRDLSNLKEDSLDHVARRMNDVRRRLDIGRAGKQVQVIEKGVLDSLDKMIKKLEQQQQQQQGGSQSSESQQSDKPMQQSQLPSLKAPMKVDNRDIGSQSGWGDLPPKEREQALQQIGRDYPAHYRELIEQYFRELADESKTKPTR